MNPFSPTKRLRRRWWPMAGVLAAIAGAWILLAHRLVHLLYAEQLDRALANGLIGWLFALASAAVLLTIIGAALGVLRHSQRALSATIESMADPVLVIDPRGKVLEANRAALGLFGVGSASELLVPLTELCARFGLRSPCCQAGAPAASAFERALRGETVHGEEALLRLPDGAERVVSLSAAPVCDEPGGEARMAVLSLQDIGEMKRLSRLRDEFLSLAAHELKTPLAAVKGYAQLLKRRGAQGPEAAQALEVIDRQCGRMNQLVQDLLDLSRLDLGRFGLRTCVCELGQLAAEALAYVRPFAARHELALECAPDALVEADRERVEQVLVNLLDNAIKFSPEGGLVRVSISPEGDEYVVRVEDEGVGIPEEERVHIFERFYQAHPEALPSRGGMGIGLTISREIVTRHGGRMWFESRQGQGSRFFFSLPRRPAASALLADSSTAQTI